MRMDQFIGLNERAEKFLKKNVSKNCGSYTEEMGMFDTPVCDLNRYRLKDKREVLDYTQAVLWSSGPMFFLALKDGKTDKPIKSTLWTEKEMEIIKRR